MKNVLVHSPAKINLGLAVLGARSDGYHEVEIVMQQVSLSDTILFEPHRGGIELSCHGDPLPEGRSNLVVAAAESLRKRARISLGARITLTKRIPIAAGLGGGSSNAAATLVGLNSLWKLGLTRPDLAKIGASLGCDVPFFLGEPTALARGKGDCVEPLPPPPDHWLVIANPGFAVSTKWAYDNVGKINLTCPDKRIRLLLLVLRNGDLKGLSRYIFNALEPVTGAVHPEITTMKKDLVREGALAALMSGSGPSVFGIFGTQAAARRAAARLRGRGWKLFVSRPLAASPLLQIHEAAAKSGKRSVRASGKAVPLGAGRRAA